MSLCCSVPRNTRDVNQSPFLCLLTLRKGVDWERTISGAEEPRHLAEKVKVGQCLEFYVSSNARVTSGPITVTVYSTPGSPQDQSQTQFTPHQGHLRTNQSQFTPHQGHLRTNHSHSLLHTRVASGRITVTVYSTPGSPQDESQSVYSTPGSPQYESHSHSLLHKVETQVTKTQVKR